MLCVLFPFSVWLKNKQDGTVREHLAAPFAMPFTTSLYSAVLMPEMGASPALHQQLPPKKEILLFWCRRYYHLRHYISNYPPKKRFCCSDAGDTIISGTTSAITPQKRDSAVLMPEMLSSPALHQQLPPKNEILLFWCRRCYHLRHYISNYPQKMRFCCSDAGDAIISGTTSAITPKKWDSAVLMPEMLSSPALLQHSYSFEISRLLRQPLLKTHRPGRPTMAKLDYL